jgi:hypothetical protein
MRLRTDSKKLAGLAIRLHSIGGGNETAHGYVSAVAARAIGHGVKNPAD